MPDENPVQISRPTAVPARRTSRGRTAAFIYLVVAMCLYFATSPVVLMAAAFTPMAFDSPGAAKNPATRMFAATMLFLLLTMFVSVPLAWVLYHFRKNFLSVVAMSLPLLNALLVVLAVVWLEVRYGGNFAGK